VYKNGIAADLHFAADLFKSFGGSKGAVLLEDYRAVMLASEVDTLMQGTPKCSLAVVSNGHPLFRGKATPISTKSRLRWLHADIIQPSLLPRQTRNGASMNNRQRWL
jgi:hypothetical protein